MNRNIAARAAKWGKLSTPVCPMDNQARTFWQSRAMLRDCPQIVDLRGLALAVKRRFYEPMQSPTITAKKGMEPTPGGWMYRANPLTTGY